jgi:hypothetical protein
MCTGSLISMIFINFYRFMSETVDFSRFQYRFYDFVAFYLKNSYMVRRGFEPTTLGSGFRYQHDNIQRPNDHGYSDYCICDSQKIMISIKFWIRAFDIGIFSRFRYFDIGNFQFRDSDINSDISTLKNKTVWVNKILYFYSKRLKTIA